MKMKKKLVAAAITAALFVVATAPVSATSICDVPSSSFDIWFYKTFIARC